MSVDWTDYHPFDPGVDGPVELLSRADAKRAYTLCMDSRPTRRVELAGLLSRNGLTLSESDGDIQTLNEWYIDEMEPDDRDPGRLMPLWYAVTNDVALFLGDEMIARNPGLRWEFFIWGKRSSHYQRHVIMGFPDAQHKYSVDIDTLVAQVGYRAIAGRSSADDRHRFLVWVRPRST